MRDRDIRYTGEDRAGLNIMLMSLLGLVEIPRLQAKKGVGSEHRNTDPDENPIKWEFMLKI
jgi:hypothetical protein